MPKPLRTLIEPHLDGVESHYPSTMNCEEGTNHCHRDERRGRIHTATDDWVFLLDSDDTLDGVLRFIPSHRSCAEAEWGMGHILPRRPDPKAPGELSMEALETIVARIQSMLWYDDEQKVWDLHLEWGSASAMVESIAAVLVDEGLEPTDA